MSLGRVDVGTQWTDKFGGWTTTEVCFHGFANRRFGWQYVKYKYQNPIWS